MVAAQVWVWALEGVEALVRALVRDLVLDLAPGWGRALALGQAWIQVAVQVLVEVLVRIVVRIVGRLLALAVQEAWSSDRALEQWRVPVLLQTAQQRDWDQAQAIPPLHSLA